MTNGLVERKSLMKVTGFRACWEAKTRTVSGFQSLTPRSTLLCSILEEITSHDISFVITIGHHLFVIVHAQNPVIKQVKLVSHTESLVTTLTRETLKVINIIAGSHDHLKSWDSFATNRTKAPCTKKSKRQSKT